MLCAYSDWLSKETAYKTVWQEQAGIVIPWKLDEVYLNYTPPLSQQPYRRPLLQANIV